MAATVSWCLLYLILFVLVTLSQSDINECPADTPLFQPLLRISKKPRIYIADNVFSEEECDKLISLAKDKLITASTISPKGQKHSSTQRQKYRSAKQAAFHATEGDGLVQMFRDKMSNMALMPEEHGEPLSVIKYEENDSYGLHFDSSLAVGRYVTVMVYLNDVDPNAGGHTVFPWAQRTEESMFYSGVTGTGRDIGELRSISIEPDIELVCDADSDSTMIRPKRGRVLIWFTHRPDLKRESYAAMHGGCPINGDHEKWIATLFIDWFPFQTENDIRKMLNSVSLEKWRVDLYDS